MSPDQSALIEALQAPDAYPHATEAIRLVETHISWVLLTGPYAYKIKKAIRLPFLDFSTLELRKRYCDDEIRLNRRLAPKLYDAVVPIGRTGSAVRVDQLPAVEFAVRMRQFEPDATADQQLARGLIGAAALAGLADRIAAFHQSLAPTSSPDPGEAILENLDELECLLGDAASARCSAVAAHLRADTGALAPLRRRREEAGFVRECHGDLHLGNLAWIAPELVPFDCLEFDRELRTIDVIDEVAFLFMDLAAHDRRDLAFVFLNRYLERTGDYDGVRLLHYYAAHRALVRAKVALMSRGPAVPPPDDRKARRYLETAQNELSARRAMLVITVGLSGSGKSTLARRLAPRIGAIHARSDVERKRLHAIAATEHRHDEVNQGLYSAAATAATYARLRAIAESALQSHQPIIIDAAFLDAGRRRDFAELAGHHGAGFLILHCLASPDCLRERVRRRAAASADPSDADESVVAHQLATADAMTDSEAAVELKIDTETAIDDRQLAREIARRAQLSLSSTSY